MKNQKRSDDRAETRSYNEGLGGGLAGGLAGGLGRKSSPLTALIGLLGGGAAGAGIGYGESKLGEAVMGEDANSFSRGAAGSAPRSALSAYYLSQLAPKTLRDTRSEKLLNPGTAGKMGESLRKFIMKNPRLVAGLGIGAGLAGLSGLNQFTTELGMEMDE